LAISSIAEYDVAPDRCQADVLQFLEELAAPV
jgi:hypothetical protein